MEHCYGYCNVQPILYQEQNPTIASRIIRMGNRMAKKEKIGIGTEKLEIESIKVKKWKSRQHIAASMRAKSTHKDLLSLDYLSFSVLSNECLKIFCYCYSRNAHITKSTRVALVIGW